MRGKQRFEVIDPASLAPQPIEQIAEHRLEPVTEHTRTAEETITADCWYGECDHDMDEDCPTLVVDICEECTTKRHDAEGDEAGVQVWPCPESGASEDGSDG